MLRNHLILFVEDDSSILSIYPGILSNMGPKLVVAPDGLKAVEIFQQTKDELDLVILDLIMPGLSGAQVYKIIREERPDLPILISSGYGNSGMTQEMLDDPKLKLLNKPYHPSDLGELVFSML
jgi:DNA-binding NtrC family response regulator